MADDRWVQTNHYKLEFGIKAIEDGKTVSIYLVNQNQNGGGVHIGEGKILRSYSGNMVGIKHNGLIFADTNELLNFIYNRVQKHLFDWVARENGVNRGSYED